MSHAPSPTEIERLLSEARDQKLDLNMTRGKPCPEQLDLSSDLLRSLDGFRAPDGTDCRNYGNLEGLGETRELFGAYLGVPAEQVLIGDNSSLSLMHDVLSQALLRGVPGGEGPWEPGKTRILCPTPGYDRHFALCEYLGVEMLPVAMTPEGPDVSEISRLASSDPSIRAVFCVPRYSNPTGVTYADEVVRAFATMTTAAPDFRIIWDNAYAVHHLYPEPAPLLEILGECTVAGHPDRPLLFASTSKITLPGAGLSAVAASPANIEDLRLFRSKQTIGPDKLNQLRHLRFLPDLETIAAHMRGHAEILRPKFETVLEILDEELADSGLATWSRPRGGYFVSVDTADGCARAVVELAAEIGVRLTPAGATFPYGDDPRDRNIRLAPSFPSLEQLRQATRVLCWSIRAVAERRRS